MTFFTASFETVVLRFGLMMAAVIIPFFAGIPVLAILALPIFLSAMTAVSFAGNEKNKEAIVTVIKTERVIKKAA